MEQDGKTHVPHEGFERLPIADSSIALDNMSRIIWKFHKADLMELNNK